MARPLAQALALAFALAVAGCTAPFGGSNEDVDAPPAGDASWAERAVPFGEGHDHFDYADHAGRTTPNFEVVGWDPLYTEHNDGETAGGYFCGEARTREDGTRLAVVNSFYSGVEFVLADVTDAAAPRMLGEFVLPHESTYDVALTPDGLHVVVGAQPNPEAPPGFPVVASRASFGYFRDACTGEERAIPMPNDVPHGPSTILVSVEDPANPVITDVVPAPILGPHSVSAAEVDNVTYVATSVTNLAHQGSYFQFFTVEDGTLNPRGTYQGPPPASANQPAINGHVDATIAKHPVTGQLLAYLADWDAGLIVLDITDPAPREVSRFSSYTGQFGSYMTGEESGNLHDAYPIEGLWDGKHYTIVGQEILSHPEDRPTGWIFILDDTDPANLQLVGAWTLPVEVEWEMSLQFSTHYVAVVGRTMFVTLYHGGVWAVDLSTPEKLANPPSVGAFIPDRVSPKPPEIGGVDIVGLPCVLDVLPYPNGDLVVWDAQSGIYVVRYDEARPMSAPEPWPQP